MTVKELEKRIAELESELAKVKAELKAVQINIFRHPTKMPIYPDP
jgi:ribosomal protein L29